MPVCGGDDRLSIKTEKQVWIWNCRGCGKGGDATHLARHIDGSDFTAACTNLAGEQPQANPNGKANGKNHAAAEPEKIAAAKFGYEDEAGNLLFVVVRAEYRNPDGTFVATKDGKRKKTFHQRRPDPDLSGQVDLGRRRRADRAVPAARTASRPSATDILSSLPKARARSICCVMGHPGNVQRQRGGQMEAGA